MRRRRSQQHAFTLLEVILALAILGLALATLGQAIGRSHQSARRAADQTELCQVAVTVLDEILVGARTLTAVDDEPISDSTDPTAPPTALVSVSVETGPLDGLLVVRVRAKPSDELAQESVEMVRWLVDPSLTESSSSTEAAL